MFRTPDCKRADKWAGKSEVGILLGYDKVGYKVVLNGKLIVARNVKVVENEKDLIGFTGFDFNFDSDEESSNASRKSDSGSKVFENTVDEQGATNEVAGTIPKIKLKIANDQKVLRRSSRERKRTEFFSASLAKTKYENNANKNVPNVRKSERERSKPDYADAQIIYVNGAWTDSTNYCDAVKNDTCDTWKNAINMETNFLFENELLNFVDKPKNVKVRLKRR